ncbi:hypothetical protein [Sphingomonas morindae]|uniref:Uncharacterized protein n=1 Tax=Sphingomonas morindae TaxID=1541170 RepID=A0ABY4XDT0_9SPHN|nr:hypothetical protein [Sphingomonas morindae]USI75097.1 hypothetical protein LHA26_19585 [Sphingomonas morindae]
MLLADSNALRNPDLRAYLAAARDHHIVLSDLTLIEMRKRNALSTSRESLLIASAFPNQVFLLKRTHELLEFDIASPSEVDLLFDYEGGVELDHIMKGLRELPPSDALKARMAELEQEAVNVIAELGKQMEGLEEALVDITKEFKQPQIKELRTGANVSDETREILFRLLKETTARFFVDNQPLPRRKSIKLTQARGMFAFRYSLCMMVYYILWVQTGRQTGRAHHLRVNDVIDMQLAALSTYFNGVLSTDGLVWDTSRTARGILRRYGAYVAEDWVLPAALGGAPPA